MFSLSGLEVDAIRVWSRKYLMLVGANITLRKILGWMFWNLRSLTLCLRPLNQLSKIARSNSECLENKTSKMKTLWWTPLRSFKTPHSLGTSLLAITQSWPRTNSKNSHSANFPANSTPNLKIKAFNNSMLNNSPR